jgi:hypothetical protein
MVNWGVQDRLGIQFGINFVRGQNSVFGDDILEIKMSLACLFCEALFFSMKIASPSLFW